MKRICAFLVMFAGIWMLLTTSAHAQAVDATLDDTLTDHLATGEDVKWYRFEMSEPGDAELVIHGLQERWDGWNNHWAAKIYGPDLQTVLAEGTARGYNGDQYSPPARFSLLALDSGTYYIRITAAGTNHFTTDSYRLELNRTYRSAQPYVDSNDDNLYVIGTESFMDRLVSQDQVRWYVLEMTEPGDAVLVVTGLQDHWDGYTHHWLCAIYEADRESLIAWTNVRGYSGTYGPSILSAPGLAAGTYYVRMTSTSSSNPLMTTFTTDPYQMQLVQYYPSASAATVASNQVKVFQRAGDVLWSFDGTAFLKLYDGECYGALMKNYDGAIVPVLISEDKNAVEYVISSTGERVTAGSAWYYEPLGDDCWYYSECGSVDPYTEEAVDMSSLPMLYVDAGRVRSAAAATADQLLQAKAEGRQPGEPGVPEEPGVSGEPEEPGVAEEPEPTKQPEKAEHGDVEAWLETKQDAAALCAVGGVSLFVALCLFNGLRGPSKRKRSRRPSSSSGSSSGSYSSPSSSSGYGSGSYSSGGYSSSFDKPTSERSFTEGGPTGCGIGGSFCGCGSGR